MSNKRNIAPKFNKLDRSEEIIEISTNYKISVEQLLWLMGDSEQTEFPINDTTPNGSHFFSFVNHTGLVNEICDFSLILFNDLNEIKADQNISLNEVVEIICTYFANSTELQHAYNLYIYAVNLTPKPNMIGSLFKSTGIEKKLSEAKENKAKIISDIIMNNKNIHLNTVKMSFNSVLIILNEYLYYIKDVFHELAKENSLDIKSDFSNINKNTQGSSDVEKLKLLMLVYTYCHLSKIHPNFEKFNSVNELFIQEKRLFERQILSALAPKFTGGDHIELPSADGPDALTEKEKFYIKVINCLKDVQTKISKILGLKDNNNLLFQTARIVWNKSLSWDKYLERDLANDSSKVEPPKSKPVFIVPSEGVKGESVTGVVPRKRRSLNFVNLKDVPQPDVKILSSVGITKLDAANHYIMRLYQGNNGKVAIARASFDDSLTDFRNGDTRLTPRGAFEAVERFVQDQSLYGLRLTHLPEFHINIYTIRSSFGTRIVLYSENKRDYLVTRVIGAEEAKGPSKSYREGYFKTDIRIGQALWRTAFDVKQKHTLILG